MNSEIQSLSTPRLLEAVRSLVLEERRVTIRILEHLREVERRRAYAEIGYASLFEYATRELGYSESAAFRRISAMRALRETPELKRSIERGSLTLSTVSRVQAFLRQERVRNERAYAPAERRELFLKLEHRSTREVERELLRISPAAVPAERERQITEELTELRLVIPEELRGKLEKARGLLAHRLRDPGSTLELIEKLTDLALERMDPLRTGRGKGSRSSRASGESSVAAASVSAPARRRPADCSTASSAAGALNPTAASAPNPLSGAAFPSIPPSASASSPSAATAPALSRRPPSASPSGTASASTSASEAAPSPAPSPSRPVHGASLAAPQPTSALRNSRFIPAGVRREVWRRAEGRCTYVDPKSGRACGSEFRLQIEHRVPFARGGSSRDPDNLTLYCAAHNQLSAIQAYGWRRMEPYLESRSEREA